MRMTSIEALVIVAIIVVLLALFSVLPFDIVVQLAFGWVLFLYRVLPALTVNWSNTFLALGCLAGLAIGLHLFLGWLHRETRRDVMGEEDALRWRPRRTGMILALMVLMLVAGTSAFGIVHQAARLLTSPGPILQLQGGGVRTMSMNNLRNIGLATLNYQMTHKGRLPAGATFDARGNALHGWQTWLLPYIEQEALFKQIDTTIPWNVFGNVPHFQTSQVIYLHPAEREKTDAKGFALSHYAANVRVLGGERPRNIMNIPDGLSNTILAGEVWASFSPWGRPANWRDPARGIRTTPDSFGNPLEQAPVAFIMADGSVRTVQKDVSLEVLRALATPDAGDDPGEDR